MRISSGLRTIRWRVRAFFPKCHNRPRVDHRWELSGIIFANCNGLRWRDAPLGVLFIQDPLQTLEALERQEGFATEAEAPKTAMTDATYLKAHRAASSLVARKRGATA